MLNDFFAGDFFRFDQPIKKQVTYEGNLVRNYEKEKSVKGILQKTDVET